MRFLKPPDLTLQQARIPVAAVLPHGTLTISCAPEIVRYHTRRNGVAYWSHRKRLPALRTMDKKYAVVLTLPCLCY